MSISIELHGQLLPQSPRRLTLEWTSEMKVREAVEQLGVNPDEIGLITINGVQSELEDVLPPDCRLCFFPYVSGG